MEAPQARRAVEAAVATASELGLQVDDAEIAHNSNRLAVRLAPCDVLARVAPAVHQAGAQFEIEVARRLTEAGGPVAELEPSVGDRVYLRDDFAISLWRYYQPTGWQIQPIEYAGALIALHNTYRQIELQAPHFTDRVGEALAEVVDPARTPDLPGPDREFLAATLSSLSDSISRGSDLEQLLHGEPHPGNLLSTGAGPLFIDLETCCRGPIEFDIAHAEPEVGALYVGAKQALLSQCRLLSLALVTTWRWQHDDQLPGGRYLRTEGLNQLRAQLDQPTRPRWGWHRRWR